jgi:histidinol-phosphatase (PHP family)
MIKTDNHIHPFERERSKQGMRRFVLQAQKNGLQHICFTEHAPLLPSGMSEAEMEAYVRYTHELQEEFATPNIRLGVELDFHPDLIERAARLINQYPFDYVLGSVHIHTELYRERISGKSFEEVVSLALELTLEAVKSGLFDTIAHLDFCRWLCDAGRFGAWPGTYHPEHFREQFLAIFAAMEATDTVLEVNSSGLCKSFSSVLPCPEVLQWAADFDLRYIFGSDAHTPDRVGEGRQTSLKMLLPRQRQALVPFLNSRSLANDG